MRVGYPDQEQVEMHSEGWHYAHKQQRHSL